ncbi:hypothetical protein BDW22DRAFT_1361057 [Trametopsis cervina]|nr:hypothetical protein BDW22DRAFT_1361057 [Trametopsis cervina]
MASTGTAHNSGTPTADALLVKRHANSQLPINNLPPEVLLLMFKHYMASKPYDCLDYRWIRVTHVCYMWREIALSAATLWSFLRITEFSLPERVWVWLQRSQQAPLIFKAPMPSYGLYPSNGRVAIYGLIMAQLHRIQELDVAVTPGHFCRLQWPTTPINALKHLNIDVQDIEDGQVEEAFSFRTDVDAAFPFLESLSIQHVPIELGVLRLPSSLTNLKLWDAGPPSATSVYQITTMLRGLHSLETLTIGRGLLQDTLASASPLAIPVSLPRLRELRVEEHLIPCAQLLDLLVVPCGLRLVLTILVNNDTLPLLAEKGKSIVSWITKVSRPWPSVAFFSHPAPILDDDHIPNQYSFMAGKEATQSWGVDEPHDVYLNIEEDDEPVADFYDSRQIDLFFEHFDYRSVKKVVVATEEDNQPLLMTFLRMTAVEDLWFMGLDSTPASYMPLLRPQSSARPLLFPRLMTLYITGQWDEHPESGQPQARELPDVLLQRTSLGSPVGTLVIDRSLGSAPEAYVNIQDQIRIMQAEDYSQVSAYFKTSKLEPRS